MEQRAGEVTELLRQLIRNACVNDGTAGSGGEVRSAEVLREVLDVPGVDVAGFESLPGRGSVVGRIEGTDPTAPTLALVGHTDVVPASPEGWTHDPFGADLEGSTVWGRGAVDMLNLTASMAVALRRLALDRFRPRGTLVFAAVADEEAGGTYGAEWLLEHEPEAVSANYVLTESGGIPMHDAQGSTTLAVMVAEKGLAWCRLRVRGTPGHGSRPYRSDNALVKAAEVVSRLAAYRPAPRAGGVWRAFVEGAGLPPGLGDPLQVEGICEEMADVRLARLAHACTHVTISPNVAHGGTKTNIIPDEVVLEVDMRTLPGQHREEVEALVHEALGPLAAEVQLEMVQDQAASESRADGALWRALGEVSSSLVGEARLVPAMMTGGTDARFWRARGAVAYGFGLFSERMTPGEYDAMFHGRDERVDVDSLRLSAELWEGVARRVLS